MKLEKEALDFIRELAVQYFEKRNMAALLPAMLEETSWIGTGAGELCRSLTEARTSLALEAMEYSGNFTVTKSSWNVSCLTETVCVVYGEITATPSDMELADQHNRITAVCIRTDDGMKLFHLHISNPDADQRDGCFYVKRSDIARRESLRRRAEIVAAELRERNEELEALTENTPGGVHQCQCDEGLTILHMSQSFLALVGYSPAEIKERFHNQFAEMIYPDDLARVTAEMAQQLAHSDALELEYRVKRSDGRVLWILDHGKRATAPDGTQTFYCILLDITAQREAREDLRLSLERHQIIMDQTTDIIFEWNILTDKLTFSSNWRKKFGYDPIQEHISCEIPLSQNIHPEDMPAFIKIMQDTAAGVPYSETEFRICNAFGTYFWNRIRATTQYDSEGKPIKAVGVILDIDADKKQKQLLLEQAQRDALTNLYNKAAVRQLIERRMNEVDGAKSQALLIIDVDDFKQVNDTYGHLCGDSLLSDVAGVLRSQFRSSDLVGRIGGDEFLVYLPEIAGKKETAAKVEALLNALHTLKPQKDALPISCSIGVALFPQKGADYFALYKCADTALYQIKARGKNGFLFYNPAECGHKPPSGISRSAVGGIDSETTGAADSVGEKLAQYVFKMLYKSIDVSTAVSKILEIVGRAYDVSRVYIFESSEDGKKCNNTFEWCNTNVEPEIDKLQNIDYQDDLGDYLRNFDENHIFYCKDIQELHPNLYKILAPQGICSLLQCAILDDGIFMGYVGFDECRENRRWTQEQVNSLTLIANVLSTFLLKLRLKERIADEK